MRIGQFRLKIGKFRSDKQTQQKCKKKYIYPVYCILSHILVTPQHDFDHFCAKYTGNILIYI